MSLPPRGAWIEIKFVNGMSITVEGSLPPRGAWIEIADGSSVRQRNCSGRSPRGERGLKLNSSAGERRAKDMSLPPRGAWIEIGSVDAGLERLDSVAPPAGSVD